MRFVYKLMIGIPEGNRPRSRSQWEDSSETGLKDTGCQGVNQIHLVKE